MDIGLSTDTAMGIRRRKLTALGLMILGFLGFGLGLRYIDEIGPQIALVVSAGGFILGVICLILTATIDSISVKRMTDQYIWIRGAHPELLRRLPEWSGVEGQVIPHADDD